MGWDSLTVRRWGTTQQVAFTATSAAITNAFASSTYMVRLCADSHCNVAIGDGVQTATSASPFLPQFWETYVTVSPGQRLSAIRAGTEGGITAANGTLWVTEVA